MIFSRDFETNPHLLEEREPGVYTYVIHPPRRLLIPGDYSISVHVAHAKYRQIIHGADHVCGFEVIDNGSERAKAGLSWIGKVGLPMYWEEVKTTSLLDEAVLR
ncbi:MAG: hypothetical protein NTZ05_11015 [Chloroflexi bacterium]|nr:hypothetical protein [Chloroflexota bacterium]